MRLSRSLCAAARPTTWPSLLRLKLPGSIAAWTAAGFARSADADDIALQLGGVTVGVGADRAPSWGWRDGPRSRPAPLPAPSSAPTSAPSTWATLASDGFAELSLDGIPTAIDDLTDDEQRTHADAAAAAAAAHPNGAAGLYSVCVTTPAFDATLAALRAAGLDLRRVRRPDEPASPASRGLQMAFFRVGAPPGRDVIIEVIGAPQGKGLPGGFAVGAHAAIAGVVVTVPTLEPLGALLGDGRLSDARPAVQGRGRRIATLRHEAVGLPLPLAFITPPTA